MDKEKLIKDLVLSLKKSKEKTPDEYSFLVNRYCEMRDGGDGGIQRRAKGAYFSGSSIRSLHFPNWKDSDFQRVLEEIKETPVLSESEKKEKFPHEYKTLRQKAFDYFKGK